MAKAQAMKPKSSFFDMFKAKPKPAARPANQSSTSTNLKAANATQPAASSKAAAATPKPAKATRSLGGFRLPIIGSKPFITQMKVLGGAALLLLVATALLVFYDTSQRTRNATYISIA